jgi:hypothetical protein
MMTLAESVRASDLTTPEGVERVAGVMLAQPQADCPVAHFFGPGVYIRQVTLKAGTFAIGHRQKTEHVNVMLSGVVALVTEDGVKELRAPLVYVGKPGRKVGYILEDCVWLNVYATSETSIEALEETFLEKSATSQEAERIMWETAVGTRQVDRDDFDAMLRETGFDETTARKQAEDESDQCAMPPEYASRFVVRRSPIEGHGAFLSEPAKPGEYIAPARISGKRTPAGRFVNHASIPNARFELDDRGDVHLYAAREILGCAGGGVGDEVTVDYREALKLSGIAAMEKRP